MTKRDQLARETSRARIEAAISHREGKPERRKRQAEHRRSVAKHAEMVAATPDGVIEVFREVLAEQTDDSRDRTELRRRARTYTTLKDAAE